MALHEVMLSPIELPIFKAYRFLTEPFRMVGDWLYWQVVKSIRMGQELARRAWNTYFEYYQLPSGKIVLRRSSGLSGSYKRINGKLVKVEIMPDILFDPELLLKQATQNVEEKRVRQNMLNVHKEVDFYVKNMPHRKLADLKGLDDVPSKQSLLRQVY